MTALSDMTNNAFDMRTTASETRRISLDTGGDTLGRPQKFSLLEPFRGALSWQKKETERVMDWNRIEGNWKQFKGRAKEKWGRLTDDDLDVINGRQEQLEGKIQERYGLAKDQAKQDVQAWFNSLP
jgi:uncharacterized protein YjbJ (UPF0337 family)